MNTDIGDEIEFPQDPSFENPEVIIVNRWGEVIYRKKPYGTGWNGKLDGTDIAVPPGTYYAVLKMDIGEGKVEVWTITVIRSQ